MRGVARGAAWVGMSFHHQHLPYEPHTNNELELMLAGHKPLAAFCDSYASCDHEEIIPRRAFQPYVDSGRFVMRDYSVVEKKLYRVLYALKAEAWRIDAYILLWDVAAKAGFGEWFERMEGALLGYEEWQNDAFIAHTMRPKPTNS